MFAEKALGTPGDCVGRCQSMMCPVGQQSPAYDLDEEKTQNRSNKRTKQKILVLLLLKLKYPGAELKLLEKIVGEAYSMYETGGTTKHKKRLADTTVRGNCRKILQGFNRTHQLLDDSRMRFSNFGTVSDAGAQALMDYLLILTVVDEVRWEAGYTATTEQRSHQNASDIVISSIYAIEKMLNETSDERLKKMLCQRWVTAQQWKDDEGEGGDDDTLAQLPIVDDDQRSQDEIEFYETPN